MCFVTSWKDLEWQDGEWCQCQSGNTEFCVYLVGYAVDCCIGWHLFYIFNSVFYIFFNFSVSAERAIPFEHMMYEHLQKWGPRKQEVKFFLRHEDSPTESSDQGVCYHVLLCLEIFLLRVVSTWRSLEVEGGVVAEVLSGNSWHLFCLAAQLASWTLVSVSPPLPFSPWCL